MNPARKKQCRVARRGIGGIKVQCLHQCRTAWDIDPVMRRLTADISLELQVMDQPLRRVRGKDRDWVILRAWAKQRVLRRGRIDDALLGRIDDLAGGDQEPQRGNYRLFIGLTLAAHPVSPPFRNHHWVMQSIAQNVRDQHRADFLRLCGKGQRQHDEYRGDKA